MELKYLVVYGGGLGEDVWDSELELDASDIFSGLNKAKEILDDNLIKPYQIFSIEQME